VNFKDIHDRVGLLVLLRLRDSGKYLLVVSTHLYWDSEKVADQMKELKELEEAIVLMRGEVEKDFGEKEVPVVWTGDFNNGPKSPIYEYVTKAIASSANKPLFRSAYDVYGFLNADDRRIVIDSSSNEIGWGPDHEVAYTSVNYKRKWTIDYIFYTHDRLKVTHLLEVPSLEGLQEEDGPEGWVASENDKLRKAFEEKRKKDPTVNEATGLRLIDETKNNNGIPNSLFGSDHIPVLAVFAFE